MRWLCLFFRAKMKMREKVIVVIRGEKNEEKLNSMFSWLKYRVKRWLRKI